MPAASAHYLAAMIYNALALGYSLADAVRGGRLAMLDDTTRRFFDWGIPALYTFRPSMSLFSRSDRPGWAEPFDAARSAARPVSTFLRGVIRHASADGPAITAGTGDARPHQDKARVKVALIDIDSQVDQLPELIHLANASQSYYDFQVVYLPAQTLATASDQVVLRDIEPLLLRAMRELDVDRICYLTRRLVRGADSVGPRSHVGSSPGNPFLVAVSTYQLRGAAAGVGVPFAQAVFRRCLAVLVASDGRWSIRLQSSDGSSPSLLSGGMDARLFHQLCTNQIKDVEQLSAVDRLLDLSVAKAAPNPAPSTPPPEPFIAKVTKPKPLRVAVLRSGNLAYTRDITFGLTEQLEANQPRLGRRVQVIDEAGPSARIAADGRKEAWSAALQWLDGQNADYYVGVGTQAATAISEHLGPKFVRPYFIFLGVSYPVDAGLVTSTKDRKDERNIAGVSYGRGVEEIAGRIHQMFPDRKLVFIYRRDIPQDASAASRLKENALLKRLNILSVVETINDPTLADMPDSQAVYFSWYTLERMIEDGSASSLLKDRLIVCTTRPNVEAPNLTVAGVAPDDRQIGCLGAKILIDHALGKTQLGSVDVESPSFSYWINSETAKFHGVTFPPYVLQSAVEVFGD
jgi:ABC-type uncharacterized transport system substrate-binding protein